MRSDTRIQFFTLCFILLNICSNADAIDVQTYLSFEKQAPAVQLCQLICYSDVRQKLGISNDSFEALSRQLQRLRGSAPNLAEFEVASFTERISMVEELAKRAKEMDDEIWRVLDESLPPDRMDALCGAHLMHFGIKSILNGRISTRLGIEKDQYDKLSRTIADYSQFRRGVMSSVALNTYAGNPADLLLSDVGLISKIREVLTGEQKERLSDMLIKGKQIHSAPGPLTFGW